MKNTIKMLGLVGLMALTSCGSRNVQTKTVEVINPDTEEVIEVVKVLKTVKHLEGQNCQESETETLITECEEIENPLLSVPHGAQVTVKRSDIDTTNGSTYTLVNNSLNLVLESYSVQLEMYNTIEYRVWLRRNSGDFGVASVDTLRINEAGNLELKSKTSNKTWKLLVNGQEI